MKERKKCRGINKAHGFGGCGELVTAQTRKYGLCKSCFKKWLVETKEGGKYIEGALLAGRRKIKKEKSAKKKEGLNKLMTADNYRATYVQPILNKIARLIDHGQPCIATGNMQGKMAGGHFISVGANRTTALNLHNIHKQSFQSNSWKGGDGLEYLVGIQNAYGKEYAEFMVGLRKTKSIKLSKTDLVRIKSIASTIAKELEKDLKTRNPKQRINKRNEVNIRLGIYPREFMWFTI